MEHTVSSGASTPNRTRLGWVLGVVAFALAVRLIGLNYDQNHHFHPDERAIADAVGRLSFNPSNLQLNPKFFAYGSFPLYVNAVIASALSSIPALRGYDQTILIGRGISAVAGTLTVLLVFFLGRRLYGPRVGLLAAFLLGACVLHVQNSHYMTTDIFLTLVVLVALVALVRLVQHGRMEDYILSGAAIGFATATKFSALPLLAPLGIAMLIRLFHERAFLPIVVKGLAALVALVAAVFIGQPYAFLDFATFSRHIDEQSRMVRNAGLLPYTNQYIGCPKYLYEIEQIVLWCMGPALGIAALWATVRTAVRAVRSGSGAQIVLLSWVVPYFLVTGWFDVKFPRYLLPIYPIVILWAAAWLWEIADRSRFGRVLLGIVVVGTALHLASFMPIYFRPHTAVTASDWVYRHIPRGSKVLTQHWDEGFPFHLPGRSPNHIEATELPYYDGEQRMPYIAEQLAGADYVALQTKRLYGAVTRDPKKYPLTNNYFYLLFAGDLGYELIYDHASRPSLFGFEIPDELADESLSVYDHPKVLIFANKERLDGAEILSRVRRGIPSRKLERRDLLLASAREGPADARPAAAPIRSSWLAVILFAALVELLGLAAYPIVRRWLPVSGVYALAKVLGVLFFAYLTWLLTSLGLTDFDGRSLGLTVVVLLAVGLAAWRRSPDEGWWQPDHLPTEALFWGAFGFFLIVRALNPEAFWGEKPMDFAFLNSLYRAVNLPPPEPWFAGSTLHYSYFGHYVVAALGKLCNIHPGITFNLGIALIAGMSTAAAFAAGTALADDRRVGIAAAVLTTLIGNLAGPRNMLDRIVRDVASRDIFNFDYFWATSRVIKDTINEYPFWSLLFADLHAHLLVMPFSLAFLALTLWWVRRPSEARPIRPVPLLFLLGLTLGAIITTNSWSTFTYAAFFPFLLACMSLARSPLRRGQLIALTALGFLVFVAALSAWAYPQLGQRLAEVVRVPAHELSTTGAAAVAGLAALVLIPGALFVTAFVVALACFLYYPYFQNWSAPSRNWGFEGDAFANAYDYVTIFGLFLLIAIPFLFLLWRRSLLTPGYARLGGARRTAVVLVALAAFVCLALTIPFDRLLAWGPFVYFMRNGYMRGPTFAYDAAPLASVRAGLAILALLALHLALQRRLPQRQRLTAALVSFAFFVTAGVDVVHIWDRMNTVFKFYLESWFLFSVASAAAAYELWYRMEPSRSRALWKVTIVGAFAVTAFTAATATYGVITTKRVRTPRPTLDGTAYLPLREPQEAAAYEWLNTEIAGIPVIAEAYGPSYQDYARVSMNTGLPTVLGWDYHVHQRAHAWPDINRRKADLKTLYTTDKKDVAKRILENYHVALVYVGKIERREYGGGNLLNFRKWDDVVAPVYENDGVTIFSVQGQFTGATPMQTIEHVPEVEGEGDEGGVAIQAEQGQLTQPRGIDVDGQGNVYVADFGNHRVQKFDPALTFVTGWGAQGDLPGEFKQPGDVAVDGAGNIYVADTWNQRIQVFDAKGEYTREIGGPFFGPRGITVTPDGRIYLVDTGNHRVRRFDAKGVEDRTWGGLGEERGQFKEPVGITTDAAGNVYVCDNGNARLQVFDANGTFVKDIAIDGWEMKVFSEPHVVVAGNGTIWVTVPTRRTVRAYSAEGNLLREIVGTEGPGGIFQRPMGIALLPGENELVISDLEGRLVKVPAKQ